MTSDESVHQRVQAARSARGRILAVDDEGRLGAAVGR